MSTVDKEKIKKHQRTQNQKHKEKRRTYTRDRFKKFSEQLCEFKVNMSCAICGENHVACLDFHHRDPEEKEYHISDMIKRGFSKENIIKEIDKCDVLCSNCHRKLHYNLKNGGHSMEDFKLTIYEIMTEKFEEDSSNCSDIDAAVDLALSFFDWSISRNVAVKSGV